MGVRSFSVNIDRNKLRMIAEESPTLDQLMHAKAEEILKAAQGIFLSSQRPDNEWRLSETTPPKYIASFRLRKIRRATGKAWQVVNVDPAAVWVEYGAHAGGETFVLRYRPLGLALQAVAI